LNFVYLLKSVPGHDFQQQSGLDYAIA